MLKGAGLLLFALFIDGLQAMISLALAGVLSGVSLIPFIGVFIGATAGPIGIVLGTAVSICLSITMGGGLIAALAFNGMFYPQKLVPAFFELVPGLNNGPVWTVVVVRCMMQNYKDEHGMSFFSKKKKTFTQAFAASSTPAVQATQVQTRSRTAGATPNAPLAQRQEGRGPTLKAFDGIRKPANDTLRPSYVQKTA